MARDREIRLDNMPSRVICEENEDGTVTCKVFESDRIRDFKIEEGEKESKRTSYDEY